MMKRDKELRGLVLVNNCIGKHGLTLWENRASLSMVMLEAMEILLNVAEAFDALAEVWESGDKAILKSSNGNDKIKKDN